MAQTGPIFLFFALALGIVGLPIPDETLLLGAGILAAHHKINVPFTITSAILGSITGITISYFLGRLAGRFIIKKYGTALGITQEKVSKVYLWYRKLGKWILTIGYYVPLLRHLAGFVAGGAKLDFRYFAMYAYTGAVIWTMTFFSIGYFFPSLLKFMFHKI